MSEEEIASNELTDEELGVVRGETDDDAGPIPRIVCILAAIALAVPLLVFALRRGDEDSDEGVTQ